MNQNAGRICGLLLVIDNQNLTIKTSSSPKSNWDRCRGEVAEAPEKKSKDVNSIRFDSWH